MVDGAALEKRSMRKHSVGSNPTLSASLVKTDKVWYFYIVKCADNSLYAGISTNVEERVKEHNKGTGARYTSGRRPVSLQYSERQPDVSAARKREAQVKRWSRVKKEDLISGFPGERQN